MILGTEITGAVQNVGAYCEGENADKKSQSMTWTSFLGDFENMRAWTIFSCLREIKILIYRSLSVQ